jgi:hypothetical protein
VFQSKRKAFDVKSWTVPDEARAMAATKARSDRAGGGGGGRRGGAAAPAAAKAAEPSVGPAKTAWEEKSSQLREAMRAARNYKAAIAGGADPAHLPPPAPSAPDPSLVPCPNCGRSFSEQAAERHIPKCSSIKSKVRRRRGVGGEPARACVWAGSPAAAPHRTAPA